MRWLNILIAIAIFAIICLVLYFAMGLIVQIAIFIFLKIIELVFFME